MKKENNSQKRQNRVRRNLKLKRNGKPRLTIFISNKNIYSQIIDDDKDLTIVSASSYGLKGSPTKQLAQEVGTLLAKEAKEKKVSEVVFDRGRRRYHGIVKEFAEATRKEGLKF
ncbi:MAG: 50S ribosomal protein L18 [Flavobacteriales bacterium]|jgi:large subunit ribosomal protein L18|nr:50S ribosomal protein L18 [Flavobacteriales bacterium]